MLIINRNVVQIIRSDGKVLLMTTVGIAHNIPSFGKSGRCQDRHASGAVHYRQLHSKDVSLSLGRVVSFAIIISHSLLHQRMLSCV